MLRKSIIPSAFLVVFITSILIFGDRTNTLLKITNPDFPGQPMIVFILDARNTQSIKFIADIFEYQYRNWLLINVGIIFINSKVVPFNGRYQVYEKMKMRGLNDYQDTFILFSSEGKLLLRGPLSNIPDFLLHQINPHYGLDNQRIFDDFCQTADTLGNVPFFSNMKSHLSSVFTCYFFYDEVCLCNDSVNTILKIMEIEEDHSEVHHVIVPMSEYSQEEISLIKHNNGFLVDFISPDVRGLKRWLALNKDPLHKHPLNELIVLVDRQGKILLISNKWEKYFAWREEHLEKNGI